jgi:hypothetical protein
MLVTWYPKVVYSSSGKIDPEASYVVVTEITNSYQDTTKPYSIKNNTTFEDAISKELKSNYGFKKNPNITNLNSLEEIEEVSIKKENEPEKVPEKKSLFGLSKKTKDEVVEEPTKEEIEEATKEDQGIPEDDDVWKF